MPRVSNSNEMERSGQITKRGSKPGRTALVQCALIAQRFSPYLKRYYENIKARRGTGKAIIALDLSPKLRQTVKTQFSANGELCHGNATKIHEGV